ncbi:MAG: hypothetical protein PHI98_07950 [Eubacteriales bacterium]|nr:hypothetical protein [Eubacteriales bacterium]
MTLRVLDDLIAPPGKGVVLLSMDSENASLLKPGVTLTDALGKNHLLESVALQDGVYTLHLPKAEPAYFERLFRNVLVDATALRFSTGEDD